MLAIALQDLTNIQRKQGSPAYAATFREALDLAIAIGDASGQATYTFNLSHAYKDIADLRDLDEAERRYRMSFELRAPHDMLGRGRCVNQLGLVAFERF